MCGLCSALEKKFGLLKRLLLTDDAITIAILLDAFNSQKELEINYGRCPKFPFKKFLIVKSENVNTVASLTMLALKIKLYDDIRDTKRFSPRVFLLFNKGAISRAEKELSKIREDLVNEIESGVQKLIEAEQKRNITFEEYLKLSGILFKELFLNISIDESVSKNDEFNEFMYRLGRIIGLADSYKDVNEDKKNKCFNMFSLKFGNFYAKNFSNKQLKVIENIVTEEYTKMIEIGKRIDNFKNNPILTDIFLVSLPSELRKIFNIEPKKFAQIEGSLKCFNNSDPYKYYMDGFNPEGCIPDYSFCDICGVPPCPSPIP